MMINKKIRLQSRLNSMIMLCLILLCSGLLAWLSHRYPVQYDWTRDGRHTLSVASRDLLDRMPDTLEVTSYARENPVLREAIEKFVSRYQKHKNNIQLHFVNPDAVPDEVRNLGISVDGELIIRYQNRKEHVQTDSEQEFTNALQRLARNQDRWLAFIEGHGERDPLGQANHDLKEWVQQLNGRGFKTQPINLAKTQAIPDNTSILVIAGPTTEYLEGEIEIINRYIDNGGNLLWLADPGPLSGLDSLTKKLGISFHPGAVIDFAGQLIGINDPTIALVTETLYSTHNITDGFGLTTLFPHAVGITINNHPDWLAKPVFTTGDHTWSETEELKGEVGYNEDVDIVGPITLGISLERELEQEQAEESISIQQRIVIIGDGDFLSNTYLGNSGNLDLGIRIVNWLSNDDEFITIPPKTAADTQINLSGTTLGVMGLGFLFILPLALLTMGFTISIRRKKL